MFGFRPFHRFVPENSIHNRDQCVHAKNVKMCVRQTFSDFIAWMELLCEMCVFVSDVRVFRIVSATKITMKLRRKSDEMSFSCVLGSALVSNEAHKNAHVRTSFFKFKFTENVQLDRLRWICICTHIFLHTQNRTKHSNTYFSSEFDFFTRFFSFSFLFSVYSFFFLFLFSCFFFTFSILLLLLVCFSFHLRARQTKAAFILSFLSISPILSRIRLPHSTLRSFSRFVFIV